MSSYKFVTFLYTGKYMRFDTVDQLRVHIFKPLSIKGEARVAVLFSGGIDSTLLAYFADRCVEIPSSFRQSQS